jgi:hypothetical protein
MGQVEIVAQILGAIIVVAVGFVWRRSHHMAMNET